MNPFAWEEKFIPFSITSSGAEEMEWESQYEIHIPDVINEQISDPSNDNFGFQNQEIINPSYGGLEFLNQQIINLDLNNYKNIGFHPNADPESIKNVGVIDFLNFVGEVMTNKTTGRYRTMDARDVQNHQINDEDDLNFCMDALTVFINKIFELGVDCCVIIFKKYSGYHVWSTFISKCRELQRLFPKLHFICAGSWSHFDNFPQFGKLDDSKSIDKIMPCIQLVNVEVRPNMSSRDDKACDDRADMIISILLEMSGKKVILFTRDRRRDAKLHWHMDTPFVELLSNGHKKWFIPGNRVPITALSKIPRCSFSADVKETSVDFIIGQPEKIQVTN